MAILYLMLPLAAASGDALMAIVILFSVLAIWWLLRGELRDSAAESNQAQNSADARDAPPELPQAQERH